MCHAQITDPPYRRWVHENATSAGVNGAATRLRDFGFDHLGYSLRAWIATQANRVQGWSVIYSDSESVDVWRRSIEARGAEYIRRIPWIRWSQPQKSGDRPTQGHEMVSIYHRTERGKGRKKAWNGSGSLIELPTDVPEAYREKALRAVRGAEDEHHGKHPAEKPLAQALALVSAFSDPGQTVFDPCVGRGTTALACKLLGRGLVAAELSPAWHERAVTRLEAPDERDVTQIERYVESTETEVTELLRTLGQTPEDRKKKKQEKTYERALRRLADARTVAAAL